MEKRKQFSSSIIHSKFRNALNNTIDNKGLLDIDNEFTSHVFLGKGWEGWGRATTTTHNGNTLESNEIFDRNSEHENETIVEYDNEFLAVDKVLKVLLNFTSTQDGNGSFSASENIKLLSSFNNTINGNFSNDYQNNSIPIEAPHIPDYIRSTSIIVCVVILIFGLIGNTMVCIKRDKFYLHLIVLFFRDTKIVFFYLSKFILELKSSARCVVINFQFVSIQSTPCTFFLE